MTTKSWNRRKQSDQWTQKIHNEMAWMFQDNEVIFCVEKIEKFRILFHIKSKNSLFKLWLNYERGYGRVIEIK